MAILSFILIKILLLILHARFSDGIDSFTSFQSVSDGRTLVSRDGNFELGFFSPGRSRNRYLGIWYKKITVQTVVWVANRRNPINDSYGVLFLNRKGDLMLLSGSKGVVWSTNSTKIARNPIVQLLDSGNLVIRDGNDDGPWNGIGFSGTPLLKPSPGFDHEFVWNNEEVYFRFYFGKQSGIIRYVFNQTNYQFQGYFWSEASRTWVLSTYPPRDVCDNYGLCGAYGSCDSTLVLPCQCLKGFKPKASQYWDSINWSREKENQGVNNRSDAGQKEDIELEFFDLAMLAKATEDFSSENKLGEGGFGPVYKGIMDDGQEIAVKRLSLSSRQGSDEFKNEVALIAKLQHRNLVKLLGCCIQGEERILVYEFMPNKSLNFFIFDTTRHKLLDWPKRFQIISGIARGLVYLHQDSRLRIIHRDLKTSNVLLDSEMNPKISDFGLAKTFGGDQTEGNTNRVVGTYGYMAPEYAIDGQFSVKSDVFSFGILVLEIVSGKKNKGFYHPSRDLNLIGHAWGLWKKGKPLKLIDSFLQESCSESEVVRCIHIALLCVQQHPEDRPSMSSVVLMLGSVIALVKPKEPGFLIDKKSLETYSSSTNDVSISILEGR
ncbi:hypothetical protein REPUB_Repub11eG0049700 [Reevesia pubescens]